MTFKRRTAVYTSLLSLVFTANLLAAEKPGVIFGYPAGDKFDTIRTAHNLKANDIINYKGDKGDWDNPDYKNIPEEAALFHLRCNFFIDQPASIYPMIQEVYMAAHAIKEKAKIFQPSQIVGIGRSPFSIIDSLIELYNLSPEANQPIIQHMAYSGSPDVETVNNPMNINYMRNVMVPKRVTTIFNYFDELKFKEATNGLMFVDIAASGAGLNGLMRLLREYYIKEGVTFPPVLFLQLHSTAESYESTLKTFDYSSESKTLTFDGKFSDKGYKKMSIPSDVILMSPFAITTLDSDCLEMRCAPVQEYRPYEMRQGSEKTRSVPAKFHQSFKESTIIPAVQYFFNLQENAFLPLAKPAKEDFAFNILSKPQRDLLEKQAVMTLVHKMGRKHFLCLNDTDLQRVINEETRKVVLDGLVQMSQANIEHLGEKVKAYERLSPYTKTSNK